MTIRPILLLIAFAGRALSQVAPIPVTGPDAPALKPYEDALKVIMQKWSIPGASLAITDAGRLVYARGLGYADRENGIPAQPTSIFRQASISKTLTGMTILKLVEEGRLSLDAKFMDLIPAITPAPGFTLDPRMRQVTVRQLLQHTGGFDKDIPGDWVLQFAAAAKALSVPYSSLTPDLLCRYAIGQKLDFDPGTRYAYNQSAYLFLGRIIEKITGKKYEDAVREKLLTPAGATGLKLGRSLLSQKSQDEVKYYDFPGALLTSTPTVPGAIAPAPKPYGSYWVEQAEAYGGWTGTSIDLMKYINALEGRRGPAILSAASLAAIAVRPPAPVTPTGPFVGLTWRITPIAGGQHWWHSGGATGSRNLLARRQNNRNWVVLMNSRPEDEDSIITEIFNAFAVAETQVVTWPATDLFAQFSGPTLASSVQSLSFTYAAGGVLPDPQTVQFTAAPMPVNITIAPPAAAWLRVDPSTGTTPASVKVSVDPGKLDPGDYQTLLVVNAPQAANGSRSIPVSLKVTAASAFSAIRNSASLVVTVAAAAESRIIVESNDIGGSMDATSARVIDSASLDLAATVVQLSGKQLDLALPAGLQPGAATITVTTASGIVLRDQIQIDPITPGIFTVNQTGTGLPVAVLKRTTGDGVTSTEAVSDCSAGPGACVAVPIDLGPDTDSVSLQLSTTGVRSQSDPGAFTVQIGGDSGTVTAVQPDTATAGVDLITVLLPRTLAGAGDVDLTLAVGGKSANPVRINIK